MDRRKLGRVIARGYRVRRDNHSVDGDQKGRPSIGHPEANPLGDIVGKVEVNPLWRVLSRLDLTEIFKTKGDLKRWSAKRTIGGIVVLTACNDIVTNGITWEAVVMCAIGVTPLCLSFLEE